jgi:S1-C subfamily serine protease
VSLVLLWVDSSGKPRVRALRGSIRVGRSADADVVLDDRSVAILHATIDANVSPPVLTARAPLLVNEIPVTSLGLQEGDVVRFGNVAVTISDAADDLAGARPAVGPRPARRSPPADPPEPGASFPFARVAAVTLVLFGAAWAISSVRDVKWRAPLSPEDARLAERRAHGVNILLGRGTPAAGSSAPETGRTEVVAVSPATAVAPMAPGDNPLNVALRSVVSITGEVRIDGQTKNVLGSGFFVTDGGMILTNAHVMEHDGIYSGRTYDGRQLNLSARERSREVDLGLLAAIGEGPFPVLPLGTAKGLNYGDQVWAIGSPLAQALGFSVTRGVVSSPLRQFSGRSYLQHDAAINPGNSGGPLVDSQGRLVGVNTWKVAGDTQGLGFAIPVEVVETTLRSWKIGAAPPAPAEMGGNPGRNTPVPASGNSQAGGSGLLSVSSVTTTDKVRVEGFKAGSTSRGVLVYGEAVNVGPDPERGVIEVCATRRDGTIARALASFDSVWPGRRTRFSAELLAPSPSSDPRSLRVETAVARGHVPPRMGRWDPGAQDYLEAVNCLSYWGNPVLDRRSKDPAQVEVHVQSSCARAVPATATWFYLQPDSAPLSWNGTLWRFFEDVSAHGQVTQTLPVEAKKGERIRAVAWRPF